MIFKGLSLQGAYEIDLERKADLRGYFARTWCRDEFLAHGIDIEIAQANLSHNDRAGTLRGMHFQWPPSRETKLVRCERGRIYDVIIDLRPHSPTYLQHAGVTLDDAKQNALFVPPGFAHGFQTLVDNTDVTYLMSDVFNAELADGVRYDDPAFSIAWPLAVTTIIDRDRHYPDFDHRRHAERMNATPARSDTVQ